PIEQHDVRIAAGLQKSQRLTAVVETRDRVTFIDQVEPERLSEQVVVVDKQKMRHRRGGGPSFAKPNTCLVFSTGLSAPSAAPGDALSSCRRSPGGPGAGNPS